MFGETNRATPKTSSFSAVIPELANALFVVAMIHCSDIGVEEDMQAHCEISTFWVDRTSDLGAESNVLLGGACGFLGRHVDGVVEFCRW